MHAHTHDRRAAEGRLAGHLAAETNRGSRHLGATGLVAGLGLLAWTVVLAQAALPADGFADLAAKVTPAVVNISSTHHEVAGLQPDGSMEDMMRRFQQQMQPQNDQPVTALGSGFVISADGYVVTNNHVIEGADEVTVNFADGVSLPAEVIGTDPQTDIALLKVTSEQTLPYVAFGDSDGLRVGDYVMAVGNPFGLGGTVTAGIVSARGRDIHSGPYDDFIQTDAAINRGNSGGPMFDLEGDVVGVNSAIVSPNGGSVGIGFAIPSNMVKLVVEDLKSDGVVERGWLGVRIQPVTEELREALGLEKAQGALVAEVMPGSPAEAGKLKQGDVIVAFDGKPIREVRDLTRAVASTSVGKATEVAVLRKGEERSFEVTIASQQSAQLEAEQAPGAEHLSERLGARLAPLDDAMKEQLGLDSEVRGVALLEIDPRGPAAARGLAAGDVIESIDDQVVETAAQVDAVLEKAAGNAVLMLVNRAGEEHFLAWSTKGA